MSESTSIPEAQRLAPSLLNPSSRIICRVCEKQFSQYTCPRCNTRYCSLHCYKSHSRSCTESFMRDNVVEELKQLEPNDATKQKMMAILQRFHTQEEIDNSDELLDSTPGDVTDSNFSEVVIQKILSGGEIQVEDLSEDEKKRFQRAVVSGELSRMIEPWEPWWLKPSAKTIHLSEQGSRLVQPIVRHESIASKSEIVENDQSLHIPPGPETPLPPVSKLSATAPSPLLAVHLVDIIYSYCFTLRLYNGEWLTDPIGSVMHALSVSLVLGQGGKPETVSEAVSHCLEQTCSPVLRHVGGLQFGLGLLDDVVCLLSIGGTALVCLLCDFQRMIQAAEKELKSEKPRKSRRVEAKGNLKSAERKVYFMMCWVHEQHEDTWFSIASMVEAEKSANLACTGNRKDTLSVQERARPRGKMLIEEV
ncbi:hypothetical protein DCAR_0310892 [Daucus carota subsp. sativus]|uniref:HIT-type domain-containing protein n=1 Tax=Daucus carota subsp. sativus TaxID=79200 RepID=A0AAF0WKM6_DAUCS|nr:PREDICTED: zinc finger HIT domain-containing protein 2 isoform X1 [Daucus carota subsp. sativus]XP_017241961.1 PREDICTED: zinc finger HIT domain-containing protein 2 isoform X1 [Daucus carota subsp. sativus]XP_017241962.1 PREDICTED: zinc finger HIT domain-containing protein 2 isoform X1 [Daucus carota subsp. sativus]XP_017241963.1 PREDICTED: zinc finger HIT domain-containing protein 2 isoform X1 [Daucus carota subsp. sativus]WOG91642.1 hypothetical protein DCAR_0310892 [Daucus carota subsp. 